MTKGVSGSGKSTIRVACMRPMGIFSVSHVDGHFGQWRRSLQIVFPLLALPWLARWMARLPACLADSSTHGHGRTRTDGGRRRARARRRRPWLCKLGPPPPRLRPSARVPSKMLPSPSLSLYHSLLSLFSTWRRKRARRS